MTRKIQFGHTSSKLKRQRQFCGLTQHTMAVSLRMSPTRYREIEQGRRVATNDEKEKIVRVLRRVDADLDRPDLFDAA